MSSNKIITRNKFSSNIYCYTPIRNEKQQLAKHDTEMNLDLTNMMEQQTEMVSRKERSEYWKSRYLDSNANKQADYIIICLCGESQNMTAGVYFMK